ncbi:MAG: hypothetical protein ABFS14_05950 [Gemmatimonadota bacterium]
MSEAVGIVVAHDNLAAGLVEAAEHISGITGALRSISNRGLSPEALREELVAAVDGKPAVVFVDLGTGSCGFCGRALCHERRDMVLLTGANLPMLLDFLFHRDMELPLLAERLARKGRSGVEYHLADADTAASD